MVHLNSIFVHSVIAVAATAYKLPELSGPYAVGTETLDLTDYSRLDPLAPSTPQLRELMVTIFYPTSNDTLQNGNHTFAPDFTPTAATYVDAYFGLPSGTAAEIETRSIPHAPILNKKFPILLFGHGFGGTRVIYTAQLEDLASRGWIIASIDHTYDASYVEFSDGRVVPTPYTNSSQLPGGVEGAVKVRVDDLNFVADALRNVTVLSRIPGLNSSSCRPQLHTDQIGVFGHSLGGNAAATAMANNTRFRCGANFDGTIFGSVAQTGLDRPFLQMAAQDHNQTNDASWAEFWDNLRGFRREYTVKNTVHLSFTDSPIIRDSVGDAFPAGQDAIYGSISGDRVLRIETAYIDAFFGYCLKNKPAADLDALSGIQFPEVSVGH
ncbi:Alpha/Beta hydrolase protein [Truncatella angustata]|uniref:1-alkyl-2-acetylglycerophosphocholine esterase n=1 Tax=Truncatella angustata TaxID=152316 RepID=A0A9P8UCI1_9PEZI|nr:Alpha/Beta hydrolase protein [Truncatella angustata]KAH6646250.1 Alpha/Beta hydrolase protein [Truncatella angustata]KAH8203943.1 hypothetical protein TruAng_001885 [Truncatella angustata]